MLATAAGSASALSTLEADEAACRSTAADAESVADVEPGWTATSPEASAISLKAVTIGVTTASGANVRVMLYVAVVSSRRRVPSSGVTSHGSVPWHALHVSVPWHAVCVIVAKSESAFASSPSENVPVAVSESVTVTSVAARSLAGTSAVTASLSALPRSS